MPLDSARVRHYLGRFDFPGLFTQELGWDRHKATLEVATKDRILTLTAVAEKRGMVAYRCPAPEGEPIPPYALRRKIEQRVTKSVREHLIIFTDAEQTTQVWQWVKREPGRPAACREHTYHRTQPGDGLIQKLHALEVTLEEEEDLTLIDTGHKVKAAFDVDKITKQFYERFKTEHTGFLKLIKGFPSPVKVAGKTEAHPDLQWYTSLMLNRLMFVYFIQKKGFLDSDTDYLRNRLKRVRQAQGKDKFHSFYRYFLLRLFHDGLGKTPAERGLDSAMEELLGRVPFLDGGFFEVHELERRYTDIDIPDQAFEKLFDFFDQYHWHLDERPLRADNEINPDVVGYIFEKYINQKQMGAYYTKEDITEYISKNTIIPYLFDAAKKQCAIAFQPDGALWRLLRDDPDRYIYAAVREGVIDQQGNVIPLPPDIAAGLDDVARRDGWNRRADAPYSLPTETWREHVARRCRCLEVREKLRAGEVHDINDLVTLNLDIWQFARDAILNAEGPELLRAFWKAIEKVTVLDPTCGSGAFLFAALRILETLYSDCLERMERFVEDLAGTPHHPEKYSDFKKVLAQSAEHPNERYFTLKSIIINNLYGVDIMEEAVEICKLRLFLKLVAQVDAVDQMEPLPDVDFNIRAGNTLVGYTSLDEIRRAAEQDLSGQGKLVFGDVADAVQHIEEEAEVVKKAFRQFRAQQTTHGGKVTAEDKQQLRARLAKLDAELDRYLADEYGVKAEKPKDFDAWKDSHQPFHWFVDFYGILNAGGFDVIIGNPPYVEVKSGIPYLVHGFRCLAAGDLYALVLERAIHLSSAYSHLGFIVPLSCFTVDRFAPLQECYLCNADLIRVSSWSGDAHPARLFEGVDKRLQIVLARRYKAQGDARLWSTTYRKWYTEERPHLFQMAPAYQELSPVRESAFFAAAVPKLGSRLECAILGQLKQRRRSIGDLTASGARCPLYYTRKLSFFLQFLDFVPEVRDERGKMREPSELKTLYFANDENRNLALACLSSSLFYWFTIINSDCRNLNKREVENFPVPDAVPATGLRKIGRILPTLMADYKTHSQLRSVSYVGKGKVTVQYFNFRPSKPLIDQMDAILLPYYGLTDEEIEFVISYGVKYRLGGADGE